MVVHIFKKDGWQEVDIVERGNFIYGVYRGGRLIGDLFGPDSVASFVSDILAEGFHYCEDREV